MLNQPMGRVVRLSYRDMNPNITADTSALVVAFRAPDGDVYEHTLRNQEYMVHNAALQLMALNGFKPSDIEGTRMNVEQWSWLLPITVMEDGSYALAENALSGGESALREAEWFGASDPEKSNSGDSDASGGGSDNDGSPNADEAAGGEEEEPLRGKVADGDVGVEIVVSGDDR